MCTITFVARRSGYALGMNRDEKLARVTALPPARHRLGARTALFPSEPNGGTWIGVNDAGVTLALINWYSVSTHVTGQTISRGEIVKSSLATDSPSMTDGVLGNLHLSQVNPFRLIGVFLHQKAVIEWRWNLHQLERLDHRWQTNTWISSGFDEPGAQQIRSRIFRSALRQSSAQSIDWLRRLHRSHQPEIGPYSICMHRDDAKTVSYTEVIVTASRATMRYQPGPPCRRMLRSPSANSFGPTHSRGWFSKPHDISRLPVTRRGTTWIGKRISFLAPHKTPAFPGNS